MVQFAYRYQCRWRSGRFDKIKIRQSNGSFDIFFFTHNNSILWYLLFKRILEVNLSSFTLIQNIYLIYNK